ncbi:MAG: zinc-dependent metalloprotease, partial [Pseudobdellovibrionaceae bacterium]
HVDLRISEIKDVQIGDGYLSFVVLSEEIGGLIRFSFYNTKSYFQDLAETNKGLSAYQAKIYFPEDEKLFGYFSAQKPLLPSYETSKQVINDRRSLIHRFNPSRSTVEFRLNHEAPEWMDDIVKQAAAGWNATFKDVGLKMRVHVLDESGKVLRGNPGDLRYSSINIYDEVDGGGQWGGYGPQLVDPDTGEIIMATSNMNVQDSVGGTQGLLNSYLLSAKGDLDQKFILGLPLPSLEAVANVAEKTLNFVGDRLGLSLLKSLGSKVNVTYDSVAKDFIKNLKTAGGSSQQKINFSNQVFFETPFRNLNGNIINQVEAVCPELKTYAESVKADRKNENLENEIKMVKECAVEISKPFILSVLLHEMGHNFGLRHNFYGSTDRENFYGPVEMKLNGKTVKTQWMSSSVMDYMTLNYHNMTQPGLYDTAAIRWGYTDQIKKLDNSLLKVDPSKSTNLQIRDLIQNRQVRKFKYCTDEDVDVTAKDPMCARMDAGLNPIEIVSNLINQYDASIAISNHRHGKAKVWSQPTLAYDRFVRYVIPMKRFYEQWRLILAAEAGSGNEYLEAYDDEAKFSDLVERAEKENELRKQYHQAADMVFNFLTRIAFQADYSCVAKRLIDGNEKYQLFSFNQVQADIFNISQQTVTKCQDQAVRDYLKSKKQATLEAWGGVTFDNIYHDLDQKRTDPTNYSEIDNPEVVGIALDRYLALIMLVERNQLLQPVRANHFAPNFVDQPNYRRMLNQKISTRLVKGTSLEDIGLSSVLGTKISESYSSNFVSEKPILSDLMSMLKYGLVIPGKPDVNSKRLEKYAVNQAFFMNASANAECITFRGNRLCATEANSEALRLIRELNRLEELKTAWKMDGRSVGIFLETAKEFIPENGKGLELQMITIEKFYTKLKRAGSIDSQVAEDLENLKSVFSPEIELKTRAIDRDLKKLEQENISQEEIRAKQDELKKTTFGSMAQKVGLIGYQGIDQETLKARVDNFVKEIKSNYELYQADPREIDAQIDILLSALLAD